MKTIYRIAKSELNSLFCSPIAWLVLVIFTFQMSMVFTDRIIWELRDFVINNREKDGLTVYFLLSGFGTPLFPGVLSYLYLYFPLLTMGLMSREFSSGSIKLLYSSPITSTQIVLGKYLSMMFYGLIMLAIVTIYVVFYIFVLKDLLSRGYNRFNRDLLDHVSLFCSRIVCFLFDLLSGCCGHWYFCCINYFTGDWWCIARS